MRIPDATIEKLLIRSGTITAEQLDTLKEEGVLLISNAPILPHHPAAYFIKSDVSAKSLIRELNAAGFEVENHSRGNLILLKTRPNSNVRHTRGR